MQTKNLTTIGPMSTVVTPLDLNPNRNLEVSAISGQQETKFIIIIPPEGQSFLSNVSAV